MNNPLQIHNIFDEFLEGKLGEEESFAFRQRLEEDKTLLETFKNYVLAKKAVRLFEERQELQKLIEVEARKSLVKQARGRVVKMITKVAAAILFIIFTIVAFQEFQMVSDQAIINNYTKSYLDNANSIINPLRTLSQNEEAVEIAIQQLENREFAKALNIIQSIPDTANNFHRIQLLKGFVNLNLQNYIEAKEIFLQIERAENISHYLKEDASWYILLTDLVQGKITDPTFEKLLRKIASDTSHKYNEPANQLNKSLNHPFRQFY